MKFEQILMRRAMLPEKAKVAVTKGLIASAIEEDNRQNLEKILSELASELKTNIKEILSRKEEGDNIWTIGEHILNAAAAHKSDKVVEWVLAQDVDPLRVNENRDSCFIQAIPANLQAAVAYLESKGVLPEGDREEFLKEGSSTLWEAVVKELQNPNSPLAIAMGRTSPVENALIVYTNIGDDTESDTDDAEPLGVQTDEKGPL